MNQRTRPRRRGLSLIEVMISLSISTMLLLAVSTAFSASASAIEMNDRFFRASQAARVTLNQMVAQIRRAESIDVSATSVKVMRPIEEITAGSEVYRVYAFDAAAKRMTVQLFKAGNVGGPVYTLATNVESVTFGPPETRQAPNLATITVRTPLSITTRIESNVITLNGSAGPRREQKE